MDIIACVVVAIEGDGDEEGDEILIVGSLGTRSGYCGVLGIFCVVVGGGGGGNEGHGE